MNQIVTYVILQICFVFTSFSQRKMDIPSAELHYKYENKFHRGERILIFSDSGRITKEYQIDTQSNDLTKAFRISTYDSLYMINLDKNTYTAFAQNQQLAESMDSDYFTNRVKVSKGTILGFDCEVYKHRDVTYWCWKEVPLKMIIGNNEMVEVATYFNPNYNIKLDEFTLPPNISRK